MFSGHERQQSYAKETSIKYKKQYILSGTEKKTNVQASKEDDECTENVKHGQKDSLW